MGEWRGKEGSMETGMGYGLRFLVKGFWGRLQIGFGRLITRPLVRWVWAHVWFLGQDDGLMP